MCHRNALHVKRSPRPVVTVVMVAIFGEKSALRALAIALFEVARTSFTLSLCALIVWQYQ
jgi:hypothetical protein